MSILFVTPAYGGAILEPHFQSCLALCRDLTAIGVPFDWLTARNESLISRGRMELTASFLEGDYTHMMWLDADIDFVPEDVAKLWNLQTDIAVGFYAMKRKDMPLSAWKDDKLLRLEDCPDEPFEVDVAGTGFMMIRREVIVKLAEIHGTYEGQNGRRVPAIYMTPIHDGILESEDYFFCRIAREAGFKIIGDPSIKLGHWGLTRYG